VTANYDAIDGTDFPLGFRVAPGRRAATVAGAAPARDVFRVEARTMQGHQKELVVTEGAGGAAWRLVSDEGANLKGTDLAPFPLAFFNAALHADYANRVLALARAHGVKLAIESIRLDNQYWFSGSFFKGTGQGTAEPVAIRIAVRSTAAPEFVGRILDAALLASPAHALLSTPLKDTFALYVNGRRVPVARVAPSPSPDQQDPFKAHRAPPAPLAGADTFADVIERLRPDPAEGPAGPLPAEGRVPIFIRGSSILEDPAGVIATTAIPTSPGARFRLLCDERPGAQQAPSGLACAAAGIAFCYMTQFTRYIEYRHHEVRAIRFVQTLPFALSGDARDWTLRGGVEPVDTHVFLHSEAPDEVLQNLLEVAENTCYLHAALRSALPGRVVGELNGAPLAVLA
jgi:hypothetical protein